MFFYHKITFHHQEITICSERQNPQAFAPSQEMRKRMGELGLIAMVQGPGPHLKCLGKAGTRGSSSGAGFAVHRGSICFYLEDS
jgi:hypothetical protein